MIGLLGPREPREVPQCNTDPNVGSQARGVGPQSMRTFTDGRATLRHPPGLSIFLISLRLSPSYQSGFSLLKLFTRLLSALSAHRASPHPTSSLSTFFFSFCSGVINIGAITDIPGVPLLSSLPSLSQGLLFPRALTNFPLGEYIPFLE